MVVTAPDSSVIQKNLPPLARRRTGAPMTKWFALITLPNWSPAFTMVPGGLIHEGDLHAAAGRRSARHVSAQARGPCTRTYNLLAEHVPSPVGWAAVERTALVLRVVIDHFLVGAKPPDARRWRWRWQISPPLPSATGRRR